MNGDSAVVRPLDSINELFGMATPKTDRFRRLGIGYTTIAWCFKG
jgi:hypothetical protein